MWFAPASTALMVSLKLPRFLKIVEGASDFFSQKKFSKDFFHLKISYKYD